MTGHILTPLWISLFYFMELSSTQPTWNVSDFLIILLPTKHVYLHFKICIFYTSSPFTVSITTILVQLSISHQKDHWGRLFKSSTHQESLFSINTTHCINLNISRKQPLCRKIIDPLSNHFLSELQNPTLPFKLVSNSSFTHTKIFS